MATEITCEERNALYDQLLSHLSGVDDLRAAFEAEEFDRAKRLGVEFGDDLRLMQDLGWGDSPPSSMITLTMPVNELRRVFMRLRSTVEDLRRHEEREEAVINNELHRQREQVAQVTQACDRVLGAMGAEKARAGKS